MRRRIFTRERGRCQEGELREKEREEKRKGRGGKGERNPVWMILGTELETR